MQIPCERARCFPPSAHIIQSDPSDVRAFEQRFGYFSRLKHFARNFTRRAGMLRVVAVDYPYRFGYLLERGEGKHTGITAIISGKPGLLRDDRTPGGKITPAPITKPSRVETNILV